jgi:hypothetical protein
MTILVSPSSTVHGVFRVLGSLHVYSKIDTVCCFSLLISYVYEAVPDIAYCVIVQ